MKTNVTRRRLPGTLTAVLVIALWVFGATIGLAEGANEEDKTLGADFDYQNYLGYEGIATLGIWGFTNGPTPPVGDWVTTHCRYIDVPNADGGDYYLRYPIHLPSGAVIKSVTLYVADFNPTGVLFAALVTRPWNSRQEGTQLGAASTDDTSSNDRWIAMGALNVTVNNGTNVYWVDVTPYNSSSPGELCVYGIQVTYDCTDCSLFADGFESGNTNGWDGLVP